MIGVNTDIPYDFVTSVLHNKPSRRSSSNKSRTTEMTAMPLETANTTPKKCCKTPKHRAKREKLFTAPERVSDFLNHDSNKLIHLDPVPVFYDKAEIKPWLQKIFFPQGIDLVIERSDKSKIIFKCKAVTRPLATPEEAAITDGNGTMTPPEIREPTVDSSRTPIVTTNCPFRIRASYSLKMKKWNIVIVNNTHSHQCVFNPDSDEYKKFKNHLLAEGDTTTIKEFEELEYKTKFKLPILPKVISCDCGLTSEVNWFDITIPEPKISGTKKVMKKALPCSNGLNGGTNATSSANLSRSNTANVELSHFLDLNSGNINLINSKTVTPPGNITNLDEIDFTNMFAAPKKSSSNLSESAIAPSLFQRTNPVKEEDDSNAILAPFSTDDFNLNKIITTPSNENLLGYSMGFNDINQQIQDADLDALLKEEPHTVDSNGTTTETSINTLTEPNDVGYLDFLDQDICNLDFNKAALNANLYDNDELNNFNEVRVKSDDFDECDPFSLDSQM